MRQYNHNSKSDEWKKEFSQKVKEGWKRKMTDPSFKTRMVSKLRENKLADKNPNWKGKDAKLTYDGIHEWLTRNKPKIKKCAECGLEKKLDLAFKDHSKGKKNPGEYTRNFNDWIWLCRSCHMKLDGRMQNLRRKK